MSHTSKSILSASVAIVVLTAAGAADAHGWSRSGFGGGWARSNHGFAQMRPSFTPRMGGMYGRSNLGSGEMYRPSNYPQMGGGMYHSANNGPAGGMYRPAVYSPPQGGMTGPAGSQPGWRIGNHYNPLSNNVNGASNNRLGNAGQTQGNQPVASSPAPAPQAPAPAPTQIAAQPAPSSSSSSPSFWDKVGGIVQSAIPVIGGIAALF